jgi:hypothetical protein
MKAGRLGSSFGFLALETSDRGDGVKVIEAIDLFEVITAAPANADTRIISTRSADEYDRIRGEFSRHLYDLLTTPLASESLPSKPDRSKRHAPIVVRPMRLTDAQRSWLSSARASAGRRGCPRPRAAGRTTKVNGPGCGHPSPSLDRGGSGEPESADPAPIAFPNCDYPQRGVVNPPFDIAISTSAVRPAVHREARRALWRPNLRGSRQGDGPNVSRALSQAAEWPAARNCEINGMNPPDRALSRGRVDESHATNAVPPSGSGEGTRMLVLGGRRDA